MKYSINRLAEEFGVSRETLTRGLRVNGLQPGGNAKFTIKQAHVALAGDLKAARARESSERADMLAMRNATSRLDLIPRADVERVAAPIGHMLRSAVFDIADRLAPAANPDSPQTAYKVLLVWRDDFMQIAYDFIKAWSPPAPTDQPTTQKDQNEETK
jgi:NAD(P)-dependent dehydrogenase (short-subunit alcohol dehydrogenase family)